LVMQSSRYALVAYVNDPVADFIKKIRRELHPDLPHLAAHLTVVPPRGLPEGEEAAIAAVSEVCRHVEPFEMRLGEVETFIPVTPTVFIRVVHAYRLRELHDQLGAKKALALEEEWPYLPHLTIVKMSTEAQAQEAYRLAGHRWAEYEGSRCIQVKELTFVREREDASWVDVATVPLGGMASPHTL
jgi:2'-5' RNA ligase